MSNDDRDIWDFDDIDDQDCDNDDHHGLGCDCDECTYESAVGECGYCPDAGICTSAGSEWCDWDCPINRAMTRHEQ